MEEAQKERFGEIMPEMLNAGSDVIHEWASEIQDGWASGQEVAALVWTAMLQFYLPTHLPIPSTISSEARAVADPDQP